MKQEGCLDKYIFNHQKRVKLHKEYVYLSVFGCVYIFSLPFGLRKKKVFYFDEGNYKKDFDDKCLIG